MKFYNCAN